MQIFCTFGILIESGKIKIPYPSHIRMFFSAYFKVWMVDTFKRSLLFSTLLGEMAPTFHLTMVLYPGIKPPSMHTETSFNLFSLVPVYSRPTRSNIEAIGYHRPIFLLSIQ